MELNNNLTSKSLPNEFNLLNNGLGQTKETSEIGKLTSLAGAGHDLNSCLNAIGQALKYLSCDSKTVKEAAATVIIMLLKKAAGFLKTADPNTIKTVAPILLEVIDKLEGSGISLSKESKNDLKEVKETILSRIKNINSPFSNSSPDEFVSHRLGKIIRNIRGNTDDKG